MFLTQPIQSNIQTTFSSEQSVPLIEAFDHANAIIKNQQTSIGKIQKEFDDYVKGDSHRKAEIKKDLLIELATRADIEILNGKIDTLRAEMNGHIGELKKEMQSNKIEMQGSYETLQKEMQGSYNSLRNEMQGSYNSLRNEMQGSYNSLRNEMQGSYNSLRNEMQGEFKSIRLWIKMLVALTFFAATFYSPTAQLLIKMFK